MPALKTILTLLMLTAAIITASDAHVAAASPEIQCNAIAEESPHKYVSLSGEVIIARKEYSPGECRPGTCEDRLAIFWADLRLPSEGDEGERIRVVTPVETFKTLHPKPIYMEEGKTYSFCAREVEASEAKPRSFQIDFVDTIQELEDQ